MIVDGRKELVKKAVLCVMTVEEVLRISILSYVVKDKAFCTNVLVRGTLNQILDNFFLSMYP